MGNRAIVKPVGKNIGVYLHWNGGRDSVEAFLEYCKLKGFREFEDDYGLARFCQVVGNFFGGTLCMGVCTNVYETERSASGLDNGIYVVKGWDIVRRIGAPTFEQRTYELQDMLKSIDKCMPENEQLGEDFFSAEVLTVEELSIGDKVYIREFDDKFKLYEVIGIAESPGCMEHDLTYVPYVNRYGDPENYHKERCNFLRDETYRTIRGNKEE